MAQNRSGHSQLPVSDLLNKVVNEVGFDDFVDRSRNDFFHDWPYEPRAAALPGTTVLSDAVKLEPGRWSSRGSGRREPSGS